MMTSSTPIQIALRRAAVARRLSLRDWGILTLSWALLLVADLAIRVLPFRWIRTWISRPHGGKEPPQPPNNGGSVSDPPSCSPHYWGVGGAILEPCVSDPPSCSPHYWGVGGAFSTPAPEADTKRLHRLIDVAARHHLYEMTCLRRSLVLHALLTRRGIPAELRIGVRRDEGRLEAHAWVEVDGHPVGDTTAQTFSTLTSLGTRE